MKILTGTLTELQQQVTTRQQTVAQNPAVQTTVQKILADVKLMGTRLYLLTMPLLIMSLSPTSAYHKHKSMPQWLISRQNYWQH